MSIEVNGKLLETDENGYLEDYRQWEPAVATHMARADDLELGDAHWEVLNFLREYYEEYEVAPAIRILVKAIGRTMGKDKGNTRYLYQLFPFGPAKQACRYAGLPRPTGCI